MSNAISSSSNDKATTPSPLGTSSASDSPLVLKASGSASFRTDEYEHNSRFGDFTIEMRGKFVGPIDPEEFLIKYLGKDAFDNKSVPASPWNDALKEKFRLVHNITGVKGGRRRGNRESVMYGYLADAINDCIDTDLFEYVQTNANPDCRKLAECLNTSPDGTLYDRNRSKLRNDKSDSAFSDCVTELKGPDNRDKIFNDQPSGQGGHFERHTEKAVNIRGQLTAYAVAHFVHQFRTHLFMVFIQCNMARLIRWNRAGAIVTAEFDYSEQDYLADFYSRYTRATPEARGIDTTVRSLDNHDAIVSEVRAQLQLDGNAPLFEFQVWDDPEDGRKPEALPYYGTTPLVSSAQSVTGRATRIFKVWDPREKVVVILKDAWRVDSPSIEREGRVYAILKKHEVRNIPTCLRSGDVNPGATNHRTQTPVPKAGRRGHVHYRLLLREVGRGNVTKFKDTREFLVVLRDILIAHHEAYKKAGLLHRDVSVGNILITEEGTGLLSDWELAKSTLELEKARRPERTGTWQFISVALLSEALTYSKLEDDRESCFHVLGWTALQYTNYSASPALASKCLRQTYNDSYMSNGRLLGGIGKRTSMLSSAFTRIGFAPGPLADLIIDLEGVCTACYAPDPDPKMVEIGQKLLEKALSPIEREVIMSNPHYQTHERRNRLSSDTWFIDCLNEAIASDKWSEEALEQRYIRLPKSDYESFPDTSQGIHIESYYDPEDSDRAAKRRRIQLTLLSSSEQARLNAAPEEDE